MTRVDADLIKTLMALSDGDRSNFLAFMGTAPRNAAETAHLLDRLTVSISRKQRRRNVKRQ